jgi:hypothetical protein
MEYILVLDIYYDCLYIWNNILFILKKNMMCQDFNGKPVQCTGKLLKIKSKLILIHFISFVEYVLFSFL